MPRPMLRNPGLVAAGTLAGTTLGAGIFALPYLAKASGLFPFVIFLAGLSAVVIYAHILYWRVLRERPAGTHLLELAREYLGYGAAKVTFVATILGIIFTLSAYLVLGATFLSSITDLTDHSAMLIFWALCSAPLLFRFRRLMQVELLVTAVMLAMILLFVLTVPVSDSFTSFVAVNWDNVLLPFGPILFALAGWTAIEPAIAAVGAKRGYRRQAIGIGTVSVAIAYLAFALTLGSASNPVTPDTISGVLHLPGWQVGALMVFGLAAIVTSYLPMNLEIKSAFRRGLGWPRSMAFSVALFLPYLLVLAGFNSFLQSVELVGGVFLATQYVAILQVARKALRLRGREQLAVNLLSALFTLAAIFHVARFVAPALGLN